MQLDSRGIGKGLAILKVNNFIELCDRTTDLWSDVDVALEEEEEKEEEVDPPYNGPRRTQKLCENFDAWWARYPRKVGKRSARTK